MIIPRKTSSDNNLEDWFLVHNWILFCQIPVLYLKLYVDTPQQIGYTYCEERKKNAIY